MGLFDSVGKFFDDYYENGILPNIWKGFTGQQSADRNTEATNQMNRDIASETNSMNYDVAMQNLDFQKQTQEYNKALQQQIFEREDTAYQRTAQDMLSAGLNPLSMQGTNGAGEAISQTPLNNGFVAQQPNAMIPSVRNVMSAGQAIQSIGGLADTINQVKTGKLERDALALENDKKRLGLMLDLFKFGAEIDKDGNIKTVNDRAKNMADAEYSNVINQSTKTSEEAKQAQTNTLKNAQQLVQEELKTANEQRELDHKIEAGKYDSDTNIEALITGLTDFVSNGRMDSSAENLKKRFPLFNMISKYFDGLSTNKDKRERGYQYWKSFWNK